MKPAVASIFLLLFSAQFLPAQSRYQHGTVTRMRMAECMPEHHLMASMSGISAQGGEQGCPEYVLVSDKVVYILVGRGSGHLIPLAERIAFRVDKNEIAVRIDDEKKESRFQIREMALRTQWELEEAHALAAAFAKEATGPKRVQPDGIVDSY
jgi:hypothetical protein